MRLITHFHPIRVAAVSALLSLVATLPTTQASETIAHAAGEPVVASSLPNSVLRRQIEALPIMAQVDAIDKLSNISFSNADLPYMRVDKEGAPYIEDRFVIPGYISNTPQAIEPVFKSISPQDAFALHSNLGASKVIYLDFNGHTLMGTAWNSTNYPSYYATAYDQDGAPNSFSSSELASIAQIWRRVAEDFAPFDVDITTEEPATFNNNTGRALITKSVDAKGIPMPGNMAGGVAYLDVWGASNYASYYSPALIYYNNLANGRADIVTEAVSHELGHNLGLSHDGTSTSAYYGGYGSGNNSWGPIMGTGYNRNVSQWSKGEYSDANNLEDDVSIIADRLNQRIDDHSDTSKAATLLVTDVEGNVVATTPASDPDNTNPINKGIIEAHGDRDTFQFDTSGGVVTLNANTFQETSDTHGGNLDIQLTLRNHLGTLLASNNDANNTDATLTASLATGRYYVIVEGSGDATSPYSDYGSLGQYFLSGNIPQAANKTTPDAFTFTDQLGVALSSVITSSPLTIRGINVPVPIIITGGEYSINGGAYTSAAGTINNGASVTVRHTSAPTYATSTNTTLTIGGGMDTFSSTTLSASVATPTLNVNKTGTGAGTVISTPAGINCGTSCSKTYANNKQTITLIATPASGSVFTGWSGDCTVVPSNTKTCKTTITGITNVTANFNKVVHQLTVLKSGNGTVISTSTGIACNDDCTEDYLPTTSVTLTATADPGYKFTGWTGCTSTTDTCTMSMNTSKTVTANFKQVFTLTVEKTGTGAGTVKATGINCDTSSTADCTETYPKDSKISVAATATAGSRFTGWTGACTGTTTCSITMSDAQNVTANFDKITHKLTVNKTGNGSVTSAPTGIACGDDCTENYPPVTPVALTATADPGYKFTGWTGCTSTTNTCTVSMNMAKTVTANFKPAITLTVNNTGTGAGIAKTTGINCDTSAAADCTETYIKDTRVSLTATAATGSRFTGWTGACTGLSMCNIAMSEAKNVTATFDKITYKLSIVKTGNGLVTGNTLNTAASAGINCGTNCEDLAHLSSPATIVTLTATADPGYKFTGWSGACTGIAPTCNVTMSAARTVTATFKPIYTLTVNKVGNAADMGTVTSLPAGIHCGANCIQDYINNSSLTLTAKAAPGSRFTGWNGSCSGTSTCRVTMSAAKAVVANFVTL